MVKNHVESETRNPLLPLRGLLFLNDSKGSFISMSRIIHTTAFGISVMGHWLEWKK